MKKFLKYKKKKICLQISVVKCRGILFFIILWGEDCVSEQQKCEKRKNEKRAELI